MYERMLNKQEEPTIGCVVGISQGNIGISMCFGLVFAMIIGIAIGTVIKKFKDKK